MLPLSVRMQGTVYTACPPCPGDTGISDSNSAHKLVHTDPSLHCMSHSGAVGNALSQIPFCIYIGGGRSSSSIAWGEILHIQVNQYQQGGTLF